MRSVCRKSILPNLAGKHSVVREWQINPNLAGRHGVGFMRRLEARRLNQHLTRMRE
jgi:hypothetical protein